MTTTDVSPSFGSSRPVRISAWLAFLALALGVQVGLIGLISYTGGSGVPASLPVTQVDNQKLEQIKKQWEERSLLQSKGQPAPAVPVEDPENARYESEHARRVEREQRAARMAPLPQQARETQRRQQGRSRTKLSDLGVPIPVQEGESQAAAGSEATKAGGADQFVIEDNLPEGGENLLNTAEARFYTFYARFLEGVVPAWNLRVNEITRAQAIKPGDYLTQLAITLEEDGSVDQVEVVKRSGIRDFDWAIESTIRSRQFENPPDGMIQADGKVRFNYGFIVRVGEARVFEFLPPQRIERAID